MIGLTAKISEPKVFKGNKNHSKKIPAPEGLPKRGFEFSHKPTVGNLAAYLTKRIIWPPLSFAMTT